MSLLLGLLLLALLSLLVTTAWSDSRWSLQIASRDLSEDRALQAAQSALRWGERWLMSRPGAERPLPCTEACAIQRPLAVPDFEHRDERWWLDQAFSDGWDPDRAMQVAQRRPVKTPGGRWWIEEALFEPASGQAPATAFYRIMARAARAPRGEPVILELLVARPWGADEWQDELLKPGGRFCKAQGAPELCGRLAWRRVR